jgi:hypothetical protein
MHTITLLVDTRVTFTLVIACLMHAITTVFDTLAATLTLPNMLAATLTVLFVMPARRDEESVDDGPRSRLRCPTCWPPRSRCCSSCLHGGTKSL